MAVAHENYLARLRRTGNGWRRRKQIGDGVVEARQVDGDPCPQEHDVAQQRLVLKRRAERAVLAAVHARPNRLFRRTSTLMCEI